MIELIEDLLDGLDERLGVYRSRRVDFEIDGVPTALAREWWTGRLALEVGAETFDLQTRFTRPFPFVTRQRWSRRVLEHDVPVEARMKLPLSPLRRTDYRIYVDDELVREASLRF